MSGENGENTEFWQLLAGVEVKEEEKKNYMMGHCLRRNSQRLGKNSEKTLEAAGFWSLENGIEPRRWEKLGGNGEIATRKSSESGKNGPAQDPWDFGAFPSGICAPTGITGPKPSQLSSFVAWKVQEKCGKTGNEIKPSDGAPEH